MSHADRIERLRARFEDKKIDSFLVTSAENRAYFSGFRGTAGYLWITPTDALLGTDSRYTEQAGAQAPDYTVVRITSGLEWIEEAAASSGSRRVGIEDGDMSVSMFNSLKERFGKRDPVPELIPTGSMATQLRAIKEPAELVVMQRAIDLADGAMEAVGARLHPGMTERDVAWDMERTMRELGADGLSFETIVASGPNGAKAHHHPTDRKLEVGDGVVVDMGALYDGYCSDITRTFVLGEASEQFRKVYDTVLAAQETAAATARAGMTGGEIDGLARAVIVDAGYGDSFGHSLGHGIGIAVHELPGVGPKSDGAVEDGMVFSIEPGIYLTGWGGVRIEDLVVMENGKPRVLTHAHKRDLVEV
ncbi:MAG: aminopeptidase P family protein [Chloroflexi bacterium]|nr:aminopeptidase P family protein [Chloroflexota bacterium]